MAGKPARPRGQTIETGTKMVNFRALPDDHQRLKDIAEAKGVTMGELLLQACDLMLVNVEGKRAEKMRRPQDVFYGPR